jgi:KUP system potassium uptake protein
LLLVLPCLVLAYLGQAAFLIANQNSSKQIFFSSIPSKFEHSALLLFFLID